jgi:hypothetical protein
VSSNAQFSTDIASDTAAISPENAPDGHPVSDLGRETADKLIAERHAALKLKAASETVRARCPARSRLTR